MLKILSTWFLNSPFCKKQGFANIGQAAHGDAKALGKCLRIWVPRWFQRGITPSDTHLQPETTAHQNF